ncbi:MAG: Holliday junction resolvase RuvX [Firmicutes bacterium]|nr:Holliday junction resolvase RuvX [Bacillota bacterium]
MRILSLDVGEKKIGVAVSDALGITAQGLGVIERQNRRRDFSRILRYAEEYEAGEIVVGLPRNMDGTIGPQAQGVLDFCKKLAHVAGVPVVTWDERLTTVAANRTLLEADLRRSKRKKVIDKLAAVFILEGYLRYKKKQEEEGLK